jgi:phosphatidate phosphatase APP1
MQAPDGGSAHLPELLIRGSKVDKYQGRDFIIDPRRTVILIDIDDCVIDTRYHVASFTRWDHLSKPFPNARETIQSLSQDYQIIYISARPWFWYPGTRDLLRRHGFPEAPIVHSSRLWYLIAQKHFKKLLVRQLQEKIPNVLIGIGDRSRDINAYRKNGLLAINVAVHPRPSAGHDAIFISDWTGVARIFDENKEILTNPDKVRMVLNGEIVLKLPLFKYPNQTAQ